MQRNGEFCIKTYGNSHCGTFEDLQIRYGMLCECEAFLDSRGFLFDQVNVDNYFQAIKRSKLSCEKLTQRCLRELVKIIMTENPKCVIRKVDLTLSPAPFKASMTLSWLNKFAPAR